MGDTKQILVNLCASMGLADHLGDVASDVWRALKLAGIEIPSEIGDLSELMMWLAKTEGATSIWGTQLLDDDEEPGA